MWKYYIEKEREQAGVSSVQRRQERGQAGPNEAGVSRLWGQKRPF